MQEEKEEKFIKRSWPFLLIFFISTAACIALGILCLDASKAAFLQTYKALWMTLTILLLCVLCGVCVWLTVTGKDSFVKSFLSVYILLLFCLALIYIFQKTGFFEVVGSAESLQAYLEKAGVWMPIVYILLQFLQVVVLPIPSIVSTVAGIALFGPFKTMLFSLIGIIPASILAFFIGRKLGNKAVSWMIGEETLKKWQTKLKGKDNLLLTSMFLLPVFPDDVLCFIAGLSSMSTKYFLIMICISRILAVSATCYSFGFIPLNEWWGLLIWGILIVLLVTAFLLVYKNFDKLNAWLKGFKKTKKKQK